MLYKFKNYYYSIKRIIKYIPILWNFRTWDYAYLLNLLSFVFEDYRTDYNDPKKVFMTESYRLKIVKDLTICKEILKRLSENNYAVYEHSLLEVPEMVFEYVEHTDYNIVKFIWKDSDHEIRHEKQLKLLKKSEDVQRNNDLQLFFKTFKRYQRWWD